jgi:hypothetical protein
MTRGIFFFVGIIAVCLFSADAATVSGMVQQKYVNQIKGAIVTLTPVNGGGTTYRDTTDSTGSFSISNVATGSYYISASAVGYATSAPAIINLRSSTGTATMTIQLDPAIASVVSISGAVSDSISGNPLRRAIVRLLQGSTQIDTTLVAMNGTYQFSNVKTGTYVISVSASGHAAKTADGIVVASENVTINFQLIQVSAGLAAIVNTAICLNPEFTMSSSGILYLHNFGGKGNVSILGLNGKRIYCANVAANASSIAIPKSVVHTGGAYLVCITQNDAAYRKKVIIP